MNDGIWKKLRITISFILSLALFVAAAPVALGASAEQVEEVRDLLEQYHLSKPDDEDLDDSEIDAMVDSLKDPYTKYFDDDQWKSFNSLLEQTFVGVGIVLVEDNRIVVVEDVIPGSPAESAGVEPGDALVSADGKTLKGKTTAEVQSELRGAVDSAVTLSVMRDGKELKFKLIRKSVQIPVVTTRLLDQGVGYLSLSGFTSNAGSEVKDQLEKLEKLEQNGLTSLVFDLRNNGGGYVNTAQEIAGLFVEKGVLAHMRGRDEVDHPLEINGSTKPYSVIILVNENSASASELLAGALQDYGVAKLVGTKTYGKGVVQSLINVKSGGMLKVTVQEYYTPNGRKVDKVGLTPDLVVNGAAEQLMRAFRLAGGQKRELTSGKGVVTLNGVRMTRPDAVWKDKTVWFVDYKLATAFLGGKLTYEAKNHTLNLVVNNQIQTLKTNDSHIRIKNGHTFIDLRLLQNWYPDFSYSVVGETIKMNAN